MITPLVLIALLGIQVDTVVTFSPRILNAEGTRDGDFKSYARILLHVPGLTSSYVGGGVIVSESWILGAASTQLFAIFTRVLIEVGRHSLNTPSDRIQTLKIKRNIANFFYKGKKYSKYDIRLIKTATAIKMNEFVQAALLPPKHSQPSGMAHLISFGRTTPGRLSPPSKNLTGTTVTILENSICQQLLWDDNVYEIIDKTLFCTHTPGRNVIALYGDNGNPLIQFVDGKEVVIGITSWILDSHGQNGRPTVFTRVSEYIEDFITPKIRKPLTFD